MSQVTVTLRQDSKMKCLACTEKLMESQLNLPHITKTEKNNTKN